MIRTIQQTPTEILDYTVDWATRSLGGDTLATSTWAASPPGLGISSPAPSLTATTTTVWLSGGSEGAFYAVTNTVTTSGGREMQFSFAANVVAQRFF